MRQLCAAAAVLLSLASGPLLAAPTPESAFKTAQREFLRGSLLEHRGDLAGALAAYEAALAADPDSAYICRQAADLAVEAGDAEKALRLARRLVELAPRDARSHVTLGRALWAAEDAAGAQASFDAALKLDPKSSETILALGGLLGERDPEAARRLLTKFIADNPEQAADAHYQLAKMEFDGGRFDSAISHIKAGLALEPDSLPLHYGLAQAYEAKASTEEALTEYREILGLDPANVALLDHMGELYFAKGDLDAARARFEEAHRLQPADPFSSQWLATDAEREGDWARAADTLKTSSALAEDPSLNLRLSYYETQAGRLPEAVRLLDEAYQRWPANDQIAYFLALGYDDLKQSEKSVKLLREVLQVKPDMRDARYQLAMILEKLNRMGEAEAEFRLLLAQKPDDASVLNYLGYSLADRGLKLGEAEGYIREALRLSPTNAAYIDSLGWVLFKQGRSTEAVSELEQAAAGGPEDPTVWDHLGDAYAAAASPGKAWQAWKRAEALSEAPAAAGQKAAKAQRSLDSQELGELYLGYLAAAHGRLAKLSAICRIEGAALDRRFSYDGLLTFRGPGTLDLDLLGPLMMPIFRVRLGPDGFFMDNINVEGVDPALIRQAIDNLFAAMREYLSGDLFALRPAVYRKGWWGKRWLEAGGRRLGLDPKGVRLAAIASAEGPGQVFLADFAKNQGRLVAGDISIKGLGYSLAIKLDQVKAEFLPEPGAPAP